VTRPDRVLLLAALVLGGCASGKPRPDYARPLPPGAPALRKVTDPARWPDLRVGFRDRDPGLIEALERSEKWFYAPSTLNWFPIEGISHDRAHASVRAALALLRDSGSADEFDAEFRRRFDAWESVGWDGSGTVFFTGYFAPVFPASRTRTSRFRYPIYTRPADLATDPQTGAPLGRKLPDGGFEPYATRAQIEDSGLLDGLELAWLEDPLSVFLVHVNGSAKLRLAFGSPLYVGYAGKTDRPYRSLGQSMVEAGLLDADEVSLPAIRRVYAQHPREVEKLMRRNESYVFFREADASTWPSGSLGFPVAAERTLATDKKIFPRGGLLFVDTTALPAGTARKPFRRFMLDQDTGGAIRAPGRADIFMGTGAEAEALAGAQQKEGRLYYFFLKPEFVDEYLPKAEP